MTCEKWESDVKELCNSGVLKLLRKHLVLSHLQCSCTTANNRDTQGLVKTIKVSIKSHGLKSLQKLTSYHQPVKHNVSPTTQVFPMNDNSNSIYVFFTTVQTEGHVHTLFERQGDRMGVFIIIIMVSTQTSVRNQSIGKYCTFGQFFLIKHLWPPTATSHINLQVVINIKSPL